MRPHLRGKPVRLIVGEGRLRDGKPGLFLECGHVAPARTGGRIRKKIEKGAATRCEDCPTIPEEPIDDEP